ncbi:MAG: hypothetical protein LC778_01400 [Acidobacteria bacterium]|nr:hypothetical protein [Acidobacteriota bacterium]
MKNNNTVWLRNIVAFCLTLAVFITSSMVTLAAPEKKSLMGELTVSGHDVNGEDAFVILNGERALSGRTFFSDSTVSTSENTTTTVKLGKLGFINLSPNSTLSLSFTENNISGNLSAGQIKVFNNEGVDVNIQTADGSVASDKAETGIFTVDVQSGMTMASADSGLISLNNGKTIVPVQTGQTGQTGQTTQQTTDDDDDGNSATGPLIIFGVIVGAAVVLVLRNNNDDDVVVSPRR